MSDLSNKTVEELRDQVETSAKIGYPRTAMPAFDELASRLAKAQEEIARMRPVVNLVGRWLQSFDKRGDSPDPRTEDQPADAYRDYEAGEKL